MKWIKTTKLKIHYMRCIIQQLIYLIWNEIDIPIEYTIYKIFTENNTQFISMYLDMDFFIEIKQRCMSWNNPTYIYRFLRSKFNKRDDRSKYDVQPQKSHRFWSSDIKSRPLFGVNIHKFADITIQIELHKLLYTNHTHYT